MEIAVFLGIVQLSLSVLYIAMFLIVQDLKKSEITVI